MNDFKCEDCYNPCFLFLCSGILVNLIIGYVIVAQEWDKHPVISILLLCFLLFMTVFCIIYSVYLVYKIYKAKKLQKAGYVAV